ncbi:MAG: hypothetical protein KA104_02905 [Candidatus Pacebacteria bacterium]|nr:hypothetical protein [Candidatus Paceibacterota bacterium]
MNTRYRISGVTAGFILCLTILVDLLQIFLTLTVIGSVVSFFIGIVLCIGLWLIFTLHGVKYSGTGGLKKVAASFGTMALESVPIIDALPFATIGAFIIIRETRKEDIKKQRDKAQASNDNRQQQMQQYEEAA